MEIPFLGWSTILGLNDEVSSGEVVDVSSLSKLGNDVEVSIDLEAPISIPFTLLWFTLPVFDIDHIPSLMYLDRVSLILHFNLSVFSINLALNTHNLLWITSQVEMWTSPSVELEESRVHGSTSKVLTFH
jgi:hypothetical protein